MQTAPGMVIGQKMSHLAFSYVYVFFGDLNSNGVYWSSPVPEVAIQQIYIQKAATYRMMQWSTLKQIVDLRSVKALQEIHVP